MGDHAHRLGSSPSHCGGHYRAARRDGRELAPENGANPACAARRKGCAHLHGQRSRVRLRTSGDRSGVCGGRERFVSRASFWRFAKTHARAFRGAAAVDARRSRRTAGAARGPAPHQKRTTEEKEVSHEPRRFCPAIGVAFTGGLAAGWNRSAGAVEVSETTWPAMVVRAVAARRRAAPADFGSERVQYFQLAALVEAGLCSGSEASRATGTAERGRSLRECFSGRSISSESGSRRGYG